MKRNLLAIAALLTCMLWGAWPAVADESLWLEAEHLDGIRGYCWPMGRPEMKVTQGHWALSGPGWAAEWNQGGESGFLSIATGGEDDQAAASKVVEVPVDGTWHVWVRYGDWREQPEHFEIRLEQPGTPPWTGQFGRRAMVDEDNEMKLYWDWAFAWDRGTTTLKKGPATLRLISSTKQPQPRQVDVIVLTTDESYRPRIKDRPRHETWALLETWRQGVPADLEPLARNRPDFNTLPEPWRRRTFRSHDFLYLWNVSETGETADWLGDDPQRVLYPWNVRDPEAIAEFKQRYGGQKEVPLFADPRIVPTFHGVGAGIFRAGSDGKVHEPGLQFARWLEQNPQRLFGMMMNYHPGAPVSEEGIALFAKYRDRFVGSVSGENLGYFDLSPQRLAEATANARTRRELAEVFTPLTLEANAAKYRAVYGRDIDPNPYEDVISCLSVGNITFAPLLSLWGARTIGYESAAATHSLLNMRWAFMRGIARQGGHLTCTYRSCNFGDSATIFTNAQSYHSPQSILDNYYSVYSGAGMTWYKFDIWYQYMAGSSMFYHEQGFDEFWRPGGTAAAGVRPLQLSPKGKLVDRFLRLTAQEPDRGVPFTPAAFLVDYAHGWEPAPFWPNSFKNYHNHPDRFRPGDHEKMLEEYFWAAYHPMGYETQRPITGTSEVYLPGVFGDIFDVVCAYPDVSRWRTIDTYPLVIAAGEIELTAAEGHRLNQYVHHGGTLIVADAHLSGPGTAALELPATEAAAEADGYRWLDDPAVHPAPRFRFRPINAPQARVLAATADGRAVCVALDRGKGRLIYLAVPHGLSISKQAVPIVARLLAHATRGLMPIEVAGDVQWMVNRTEHGWLVTMLNPAGADKPQQGITPTDSRQNRQVAVHCRVPVKSARDRLLASDSFAIEPRPDGAVVRCEVPAGGVRILELK